MTLDELNRRFGVIPVGQVNAKGMISIGRFYNYTAVGRYLNEVSRIEGCARVEKNPVWPAFRPGRKVENYQAEKAGICVRIMILNKVPLAVGETASAI